MNDEQREEIERLDRWLAVQEVTGRRFFPCDELDGGSQWCTMNTYSDETGVHAPMAVSEMEALWEANDYNNGSPGAVRAKLHELYPWLDAVPSPTGETAVSETVTR